MIFIEGHHHQLILVHQQYGRPDSGPPSDDSMLTNNELRCDGTPRASTGGTALHQIDEGHDKCLLRAGRLGRARSGTRSFAGPTILRESCNEASGRMSLSCMDDVVVVKRSVLRIPRGIAHCCATKAGGVVCQLPRIMTARQTGLLSLLCGGGRRGMRLVCSVDRRLATALQYLTHSRRVAREPLETPVLQTRPPLLTVQYVLYRLKVIMMMRADILPTDAPGMSDDSLRHRGQIAQDL